MTGREGLGWIGEIRSREKSEKVKRKGAIEGGSALETRRSSDNGADLTVYRVLPPSTSLQFHFQVSIGLPMEQSRSGPFQVIDSQLLTRVR